MVLVGRQITFYDRPKHRVLSFKLDPDTSTITIDALDMRIGEFRVALESGRLPLEMEAINRKRFSVLVGAIINGAKAGVFLNGRQPFPNSFSSVAPNHDEAFGITLGRCAS